MKIDYLIPEMYLDFDMEAQRNAGGGMIPNIHARANALRQWYDVRLISDVKEIQSDVCLIEALWFCMAHDWQFVTGENEDTEGEWKALYSQRLDDLFDGKSSVRKIVTCCELEIARLPWWARAKFNHYPAGVVMNTPYLWNIVSALGINPIGYLCDAVDPDLFKPAKKELSVIAVGGLKHIKNPYLIFEVFDKLKDSGMKRVYIGSAQIWSNENRAEDAALASQIHEHADVWIENASYLETAYHLSSAGIGINDTWHDVSSRTNQEMLMSGVISIGGQHPLFEGRPGIHGLETADDFVEAIWEVTNEFSEIPAEKGLQGRDWALENVSTDAFLAQFNELIRNIYL